ncbi:carbohydrate kinase family protein [Streptomyces cavernicola]|uniref:PfkB family carbohydrate kinase n=1 Tax=Streptomyces cavernicola TaxID=3043613 RepID=A0ABT6S9K1_9ACTN|nr:PfkB family carbohydrate kinase [Streptomyces sp. B-S-A6]MDI3404811.1 PfkB family carbohydrate kinase [Streptomyces sp. B-S-A6]
MSPGARSADAAGSGSGAGGLLVLGDVVTDVVARYRAPLAHGTDTAAAIRLMPGGAGANVACWAARWGCAEVTLLGRVGAESAAWHEQSLRAAGVRPRLVVDEEAATGTVICLVDGAAERTFLTDSGAVLRLRPADWSPAFLDGVAHLHLSGYLFFADGSRATARLALSAARARGITVSVDPASAGFLAESGVDRFLDAVEGADVLLPNWDEAMLLAGLPTPAPPQQPRSPRPPQQPHPPNLSSPSDPSDPSSRSDPSDPSGRSDPSDPFVPLDLTAVAEAAAKLGSRFPLVAVTAGAEGALVAEAGAAAVRVPGVRVAARDTTGAGDAFTGAFLATRLAGASAADAAAEGCRAGARAVLRVGGRPG